MTTEDHRAAHLTPPPTDEMTVHEMVGHIAALGRVFRQIEEMEATLTAMERQLSDQVRISEVAGDLADCKSRLTEMLEAMDRIKKSAEATGITLPGVPPKF